MTVDNKLIVYNLHSDSQLHNTTSIPTKINTEGYIRLKFKIDVIIYF